MIFETLGVIRLASEVKFAKWVFCSIGIAFALAPLYSEFWTFDWFMTVWILACLVLGFFTFPLWLIFKGIGWCVGKMAGMEDGETSIQEHYRKERIIDSDYSGGGGSTYVAPVPVAKTPRAKPVTYSVYIRNSSGYERKFTTVDRAAQAIQMAQTQVRSNANRGCFIRVAGSDGSTIWTGQA